MALNRSNGVFSPTMFHPDVFDTGLGRSKRPEFIEEPLRERLLREDEEILALILAIEAEE